MTDMTFASILLLGPPLCGALGYLAARDLKKWWRGESGHFMGWWSTLLVIPTVAVFGWLLPSGIEWLVTACSLTGISATLARVAITATVLFIAFPLPAYLTKRSWRMRPYEFGGYHHEYLAPPWWANAYKWRQMRTAFNACGGGWTVLLGLVGVYLYLKTVNGQQVGMSLLQMMLPAETLKMVQAVAAETLKVLFRACAMAFVGVLAWDAIKGHIANRDAVWWYAFSLWVFGLLVFSKTVPEQASLLFWPLASITAILLTLAVSRSLYLRVSWTRPAFLVLILVGLPSLFAAWLYFTGGHAPVMNDHPMWVLAAAGTMMAVAWVRLRQIYPAGEGHLRAVLAGVGRWSGLFVVVIPNAALTAFGLFGIWLASKFLSTDNEIFQMIALFCVLQAMVGVGNIADKLTQMIPAKKPDVDQQSGKRREGNDKDYKDNDYLR